MSVTAARFKILVDNITHNTPEPGDEDDALMGGPDPVYQFKVEATESADRIQAALDLATRLSMDAASISSHPEYADQLTLKEVARRAAAINSLLTSVIRSRAEDGRMAGCEHTYPCPQRFYCTPQ